MAFIMNDQQMMDKLEKEGLDVDVYADCLSDMRESDPNNNFVEALNNALEQLGCGFHAVKVVSVDDENGYTWLFEDNV